MGEKGIPRGGKMEESGGFILETLCQIFDALVWPYSYWWVLLIFILAYLTATLYYSRQLNNVKDKIHLAPISVKGGLSQELGTKTIGLMLIGQIQAITKIFRKATAEHASIYAAETVAADFPCMNTTLVDATVKLSPTKITFKEELVVKIGTFEVPIGALLNLFFLIFRIIPVPFRKRYYRSMIHTSLISMKDETQVVVYRKEHVSTIPGKTGLAANYAPGDKPRLLTRIRSVEKPSDLLDLLRDAVFLILELHGDLEGRRGLSMRYFSDGLNALNTYRFTANVALINKARDYFAKAVEADDDNCEALYFYGCMLHFERTQNSIAAAIKLFTKAQKTSRPKLKALVYAGLANCYAQQFHRLAKREKDVLAKSREMSERAAHIWKEATQSDKPHPLILYAQALQAIIDEGMVGSKEDVKNRFIHSAGLLWQAIQTEPEENGMFYNSLGWLFLKLTEWEHKELKQEEGLPKELAGNTAKKAEYYLRYALDLNPDNKRSHANLCLLYATPFFRSLTGNYLERCRYHGLKAVLIDPNYINGYRDLALSLIRYGKSDDAFQYFIKALQTADPVAKDLEIINDVVKVLQDMKMSKKALIRWRYPDPELLQPHKM